MIENKKEKIIAYTYILILYLLIFQNFLQSFSIIFQYLDEFISFLGILVTIIDIIRKRGKVNKLNLIILLCIVLIFITGFYAVLKNKYQTIMYALLDAFLLFKFFFVYFLAYIISKKADLLKYSKQIYFNLKIIVIILFIFTIANYIFKIYPFGERYGIMVNKLFFEHPTYLAGACIGLIVNLETFSKKLNNKYIFISLLILISTLRMKAIGAAIAILLVTIYVNYADKKISISKISVIGLLTIIVALPQIRYYFIDIESSARRVLTDTSIEIANDNFPLGTGFGTYASFVSGENYSPVYEMYGISNVYGIEKERTNFISDTFWPMILGQLGYLGALLYMICLITVFYRIQKQFCKENKRLYIAKVSALIYLLVSSIAEPAFVNPISIPLALILGLESNIERNKS